MAEETIDERIDRLQRELTAARADRWSQVAIRLKASELERLRANARSLGMSVTAYIRSRCCE